MRAKTFFHTRIANHFSALILAALCVFAAESASAQTEKEPDYLRPETAITEVDKELLSKESGIKDKTQSAISLLRTRMTNAETANSKDDFQTMFSELGAFHGVLDDFSGTLATELRASNKHLREAKRFEIALRELALRAETIKRELPPKYEPYVNELLKNIKETRSRFVESFFSDNVVKPSAS